MTRKTRLFTVLSSSIMISVVVIAVYVIVNTVTTNKITSDNTIYDTNFADQQVLDSRIAPKNIKNAANFRSNSKHRRNPLKTKLSSSSSDNFGELVKKIQIGYLDFGGENPHLGRYDFGLKI